MNNIRPSSDLRNKYSEVSNLCKESKEAVFITVNGRGDTVLLGYENYLKLQAELELLKNLAEADEDVRLGRISDAKETFDELRNKLENL
ncbi:MAG: type II toxin-antitoxin system Phd/YefM family antitoxin [Bacilli bacterium]|jgi:prevent-host-death family protein|nr:type II toxin-antitoxin system Phd/YefM family antitoxin [Bacilli bacterium]